MARSVGRKPLLAVLAGGIPSRRPVWFMRQAGRYLPEYREIRRKAGSFLDLCYSPALASQATLQPVRRFDIDAAILFADILVLPHAMGVSVGFSEGEGPVLGRVLDARDVASLGKIAGSRQAGAVYETVARVRAALPSEVALIGFCGGPWTVASYMVEGRSSDREKAIREAYGGSAWFDDLVRRITEESVNYLCGQIEAGAEVVQIFDSWAGDLVGEARRRFVLDPVERIATEVKLRHPGVAVIAFCRGVGVDQVRVSGLRGVDGISVETGMRLDWLVGNIASGCAVQGNLDPIALLAGREVASRETRAVLKAVPMERHVFNLGHGIRPDTPIESVEAVVEAVRVFDYGAGG
jgi:uroporphyrinogen decarboxylase